LIGLRSPCGSRLHRRAAKDLATTSGNPTERQPATCHPFRCAARTCCTRPPRRPVADEPGAGFRVLCSYSHLVFDSCQQRQRHLILIRRQDVGTCRFGRNPAECRKAKSPYAGILGAPGWNRTSDTRFRNHAELVAGRSRPCAKVLHGPRFCASLVLGSSQACWTVTKRLVGNVAAIVRTSTTGSSRRTVACHSNAAGSASNGSAGRYLSSASSPPRCVRPNPR
jgi:hypothetical protein